MAKKRIGIIGLGKIAKKVYLPILSRHEKVEIVGVASRSEETVKAIGTQYRISDCFTNVEDLLAQKPEAVFVHSSTESHGIIAQQCLKAGVHVYVDKPISYNIKESIALAELAQKMNLLLCVGFNRRFAPRYVEAKSWMEAAGGFTTCIIQKHRTGLQNLNAKSTLYDDLIHILDLMIWLNNGQYQLEAYRQQTDEKERLLHASGMMRLGLANGSFSMDRNAALDLEKLELQGSRRSVEVINLEAATFCDQKEGIKKVEFGTWEDILFRRGFVGIVDHFLESINNPSNCTIQAHQVLASHELIEQMA